MLGDGARTVPLRVGVPSNSVVTPFKVDTPVPAVTVAEITPSELAVAVTL